MSFLFASQFDAPAHFASILWWILHISKSRTSPPTSLSEPFAICLHRLYLTSQGQVLQTATAPLCLSVYFPKGIREPVYWLHKSPPFSVSFSASSRHSHGRAKVAPMLSLRAINLTGKKKQELPLTLFVSTAIPNAHARPSLSPQPFLCRW